MVGGSYPPDSSGGEGSKAQRALDALAWVSEGGIIFPSKRCHHVRGGCRYASPWLYELGDEKGYDIDPRRREIRQSHWFVLANAGLLGQ